MRDDEDPFPPVPRADATSRKYKRLHLVACGFQVKAHIIECHADEASNILDNRESGSDFRNKSEHFRPEMAVVLRASLLSGDGKGLAGDAAGEESDASFLTTVCSPSPLVGLHPL
jgi:hypothetical protein